MIMIVQNANTKTFYTLKRENKRLKAENRKLKKQVKEMKGYFDLKFK